MTGNEDLREASPRDTHGTGMNSSSDQVLEELSTIMPVIASVMSQEVSAGSCTFFIYDEHQSRTIAVFRHGESQLWFPAPVDADGVTPASVPVEAEVLRTRGSIQRVTDDDFRRFPLLNTDLREQSNGYVDLIVPLIHHDHVYGVAYLWRAGNAEPFSPHEVASAGNLASVGAMAVEFARQYRDERYRRQRLNALLNIASLSASHYSVDQVLPEIAAIARSALEVDVCNLYVFDPHVAGVTDAYTSGLNDEETAVFQESQVYAVSEVPAELEAAGTLEPVIVTDPVNQLAYGSKMSAYAGRNNISEILLVPILSQQSMTGAMYLWNRDPAYRFNPDELTTIQAIASQAGGVIQQARLFEEEQRHISDTQALRRIGESVLNSDSLDEVFDELADVLNELIPYDYCFVGRVDEDSNSVVVAYMWGDFPPDVIGYRIPLDDSLTGRVARTKEIVNIADHNLHGRSHRYSSTHLPIYSVLIAPLITESGMIGVLYAGRKHEQEFDNRDERLMALFSQQAAAAIERTQARESLMMNAKRQTFLAELTNALIATEDPVSILQKLCEMTSNVLADTVIVGLTTWRYGEVQWHGCASTDHDRQQFLMKSLETGVLSVEAERIEYLANADSPSFTELADGAAVDGRVIHPTARDVLRRLDARQILSVPMRYEGRAPGLLILISSDPDRRLDDPELEGLAMIVSHRIGDALERRQMARNREALLRFSEAINTHADLEELLELFLTELQDLLPYDQLYLGKHDPETDQSIPLAYVNPHGLEVAEVAIASNRGISGEAMRTRRAILDNDAHLRQTSAYGSEHESSFYATHGESAMATPLISDHTVIGVVFIGRSGTNRFSESDFETFLLFSGLIASAIHRTELLERNNVMYRASVEVLAAVVDAKDPTTLEHSRNVARYSRLLAEAQKLPTSMVETIELAGLLHDIGKISIPDHVLRKPGPLTAQERALINTHPERGERIISQHPALMKLTPLVRNHHERVDGTGYPDGLSGDQIPPGAGIISIADAFDTITSQRTYQRRRTVQEALLELKRNAGTQFDTALVELFVQEILANPEVVVQADTVVRQ